MSTERSSVGFGSVRIRAPYIPSHNGPVEMDSNISLYRDEAMFEVILKFSLENNEFPQVKSPLSLHREEAIKVSLRHPLFPWCKVMNLGASPGLGQMRNQSYSNGLISL